MSAAAGTLVAIGVGNVLLGDDGAGVRVIEGLRRLSESDPEALPPATRLVDGGTLGSGLLDEVASARALLIVDAVDLGLIPGSVAVWRGGGPPSAHDDHGIGELLSVARLAGILPSAVTVVGIGVDVIDAGTTLSPRVESAVGRAVTVARRELRALDRRATRAGADAQLAGRVPAGVAG